MRPLHTSLLALALTASSTHAAQLDIIGPPGSVTFGEKVYVLPNGNIVVTDPFGPVSNVGVVHLYSPAGELISSVTGSSADDRIGNWGIVVLANGNFVIISTGWDNGSAVSAGAVTWVDGNSGLTGVISSANSQVGSAFNDGVNIFVTALSNGDYVVARPLWSNGASENAGAVTWCNGDTGCTGVVSAGNSLIGTSADDNIGSDVVELTNGNYVVASPFWNNGATQNVGAVTWASGDGGRVGVVSPANSLIGSAPNDRVGYGVTALSNGNYVIASPLRDNGAAQDAGAVTWANGESGRIGVVSPANSLVGTSAFDKVGVLDIVPLSNGNYVIGSPLWDNGAATDTGAVTWANGTLDLVGVVSPSNSLVGSSSEDFVGAITVALANGNYVTGSRFWSNGTTANVGAVTWMDGSIGLTGPVSSTNSLIGSSQFDFTGSRVIALTNGNYVVGSDVWDNGSMADVGAVTLADGSAGVVGVVSSNNSLIGLSTGDQIGSESVTALTNGNYVVSSPLWDNASAVDAGAVTWCDGGTGRIDTVRASNSLVGTTANDQVGSSQTLALSNGNYVVASTSWNLGGIAKVGAVTWGDGEAGLVGPVSPTNSLIGNVTNDQVGDFGLYALEGGKYVSYSIMWDAPGFEDGGAVTLGNGTRALRGPITPDNSVQGTTNGIIMEFDYDAVREQLVVGRPGSNIVSLFTLPDATRIFANGFEDTQVVTGAINLPVANDFPGSALDLVTGSYLPYDENHDVDINLYNRTGGLRVYWYANLAPDLGGVSTDGVSYDVLHSGDVIGAQSPVIRSQEGLEAHWWGGADGYLGIAFLNEETGATNYGYIHLTTSAPNGFPAQVLEYAYNNAGNAITVP